MRIITVYKGDELVANGTESEVCNLLGLSRSALGFIMSPSYAKRREKAEKGSKGIPYYIYINKVDEMA